MRFVISTVRDKADINFLQVGGVYKQMIVLKNMTTVGQKIRVIPPVSDDFSIANIVSSHDMLIASGMKTSYSVFSFIFR